MDSSIVGWHHCSQFSVPQIEYPLGGSSKKGSHVYFLLQVFWVILLFDINVVLMLRWWHDVTIVPSDITIVVPWQLSTGSKHDYLFCYCPLVGSIWGTEMTLQCFMAHFNIILTSKMSSMFIAFCRTWNFENWTTNKDFRSMFMIFLVKFLFIVRFSKRKVLQKELYNIICLRLILLIYCDILGTISWAEHFKQCQPQVALSHKQSIVINYYNNKYLFKSKSQTGAFNTSR